VVAALMALRRPLTLLCFDAGFAASVGLPAQALDRALLGLGLAVTVAGVKLVGLVLIVALLIIPPVAARFWTDRVEVMAALAALFGAVSGFVGAAISASGPQIPTGPAVVLTAFAIFAVSLLAAPRRGAVARWLAARSSAARGAPA
jgi:manganese/zinc/iron transport system permease protein